MLDKNAAAGAPSRAPDRLGRYELIARIADGGMAEVYLARQLGPMNFQKIVVVKKIHPNLARQKEFIGMLLDEARISALIKHPRVVDIYDLGVSRGTYFIAMEYLAGQPLTLVITRGRARTPLDVYATARIVADAAEGLDAAHNLKTLSGRALELVHRDVSPSNIIVLYDGGVKLVDFGVAKARGRITETGKSHIKGKVGYVSPEQIMENPVDRRSDVFSLGVVMWEALALRRLFDAESEAGKLKQILDGVPLPPSAHRPEVPYELDRICLRALAVKPEDRFQTAGEMQQAIEEFLRDAGFRREAGAIQRFMTATFAAERAQHEGLLRRACEVDRSASRAAAARPVKRRAGGDEPDIDTGVQTFVREAGDLSSPAIGSGALPTSPAALASAGATGPTVAAGTPPNRAALRVPVLASATARTPIERPIPIVDASVDTDSVVTDADSVVTEVPRARGKRGSGSLTPVNPAPTGALRQSSRMLPLRAPPGPEEKDEEGPSVVTDVDEADDYRDVTEVDSAAELRFDVLVPPTAVPGAAARRAPTAAPEAPRGVEGSGRTARPTGKGPRERERKPSTAPPAPPAAKAKAKTKAKTKPKAMANAEARPKSPSAPPAAASIAKPGGAGAAAASAGAPDVPTVIREMGEPVPLAPPEPADFPLVVEGRPRKLLWMVLGGVGAAAVLLVVVIVWAMGRGGDGGAGDRTLAASSGEGAGAPAATAAAPAAATAPAAAPRTAEAAAAEEAAGEKAAAEAAAAAAEAAAAEKAAAEEAAAEAAAAEKAAAEKEKAAAEKAAAEKEKAAARAAADKSRARGDREVEPVRRPAGNPAELYREGARLYLSGDLAAARGKFQAALAVSSRFAPAHRGLGLIHERTGNKARAIRSLETYLRLAPRAPDAAAVRARIERLRR